jgi:hypothetical protein
VGMRDLLSLSYHPIGANEAIPTGCELVHCCFPIALSLGAFTSHTS